MKRKKLDLVSICVPCYNCEDTIYETLISLVNQTYKNVEILIGDNCSTDNTHNIIKKFNSYKRIKYFCNKTNLGYTGNINNLIKRSKGKYVCVFHADDVYDKTIIEKQIYYMKKYMVGAVFSLSKIIDKNGNVIRKVPLPFQAKDIVVGSEKTIMNAMIQYGNFLVCSSAMVLRKVYDEVGYWKKEPCIVEDQELWMRILKKYKIGIINEYLVKYRQHLNQDSIAYNKLRTILSPEYNLYDNWLKENNVDKSILIRYNKMKSKAHLFYAVGSIIKKDKKSFKINLEQSKKLYTYPFYSVFSFVTFIMSLVPLPILKILISIIIKIMKIFKLNKKFNFLNFV